VKGVLFNVAQEVVERRLGADVWDDVLDRSNVDGAFTSLGNYPDSDLTEIVRAVAEVAQVTANEVLYLVGREGFADLAARHEHLLAGFDGWRSVLVALDDVIHPEVLKIYPDASVPRFSVLSDPGGPGPFVLEYRSERGLCRLAEGLIVALGDAYGHALSVEHRDCVHRGGESCVLEIDE
jgi:hypothetical protein